MSLSVRGLGTATPNTSIEQSDAAAIAKTLVYNNDSAVKLLARLYRRTQVKRRASVLLESNNGSVPHAPFYPAPASTDDRGPATEARMQRFMNEAAPLAHLAVQQAIENGGLTAEEVTHLITVSCTGFYAPGVDFALIKQLGLSPNVARVNVGFMGCHGAFNGLRVAQSFVAADPTARVLMCCVELCTLHFYYGWDAEKMVANALFADGAAALVAQHSNGHASNKWQLASCASYLLPDSEDVMTWNIGDYGFEMTLSNRVPEIIQQHVRPWLADWLGQFNLSIEEVGSWAIHAGGPRIIQSVAEALDLPPQATDASNSVLAEHGNMSSATVLFVIDRLQRMSAQRPCVALAFGPGLVAEAALFV